MKHFHWNGKQAVEAAKIAAADTWMLMDMFVMMDKPIENTKNWQDYYSGKTCQKGLIYSAERKEWQVVH